MNRDNRPILRMITLILGLITMLVGILMATVPSVIQFGHEWILAMLLIGGAIMSFGFAVTTRREDVRILTALLGVLSLVTGLIVYGHPLDTFITLTTLLGIYFILESGLMTGIGLSLRPYWSASLLMFLIAAVSFVMSALIWLRLAGASKGVIVGLLGISFIARGIAYVVLSSMMKRMGTLPPVEKQPELGTTAS